MVQTAPMALTVKPPLSRLKTVSLKFPTTTAQPGLHSGTFKVQMVRMEQTVRMALTVGTDKMARTVKLLPSRLKTVSLRFPTTTAQLGLHLGMFKVLTEQMVETVPMVVTEKTARTEKTVSPLNFVSIQRQTSGRFLTTMAQLGFLSE